MSEMMSDRPQPEISSADEEVFNFDSAVAVALPPEMLTHLLEMYCKNLDLCELKKLRLVSKTWRDALEKLWNKRATVCLTDDDINDFLEIIKQPSFNYLDRPLRKFQITMAMFTKTEAEIPEGIWDICAASITHLELKKPRIGNFHKLLETILLKLVNMEKFSLVAPETLLEVATQDQDAETLANIKREKLTYIKLDMREASTYSSNAKEFPYPLTWYQFLSSFPNLQQLELFSEDISFDSFRQHEQCLQAVKTLSLEGGLQHLKHLQLWRKEFPPETRRNFTNCVTDICLSNLPSLESLHVEFKLPYFKQAILSSPRILKKFGSKLKRLSLNFPVFQSQVFPFGHILENLEHLSVSWDIAHFIRNANCLPKLKSFSVSPFREINPSPTNATIIWQENINDVTTIRRNETRKSKKELPSQIHNYDSSSEADEALNEDFANFHEQFIRLNGFGFLFEGYKLLRGVLIFENVTSLHLECKISCKVFKNVPKWMPNVTTLEAPLAACAFPVVCDKWRNLEKLTLLHDWDDRFDNQFVRYNNFVPVDDCAILGKKHLTSSDYRCSFDPKRAQGYAVPSQTTDGDSIVPNISYLTHLKYFKMQTGEATVIGENFHLSNASALHGFYNLPQLEYLEIIADLEPETIQELFKRVPRCVVYQLCESEERDAKYYGMRNFNLGKYSALRM